MSATIGPERANYISQTRILISSQASTKKTPRIGFVMVSLYLTIPLSQSLIVCSQDWSQARTLTTTVLMKAIELASRVWFLILYNLPQSPTAVSHSGSSASQNVDKNNETSADEGYKTGYGGDVAGGEPTHVSSDEDSPARVLRTSEEHSTVPYTGEGWCRIAFVHTVTLTYTLKASIPICQPIPPRSLNTLPIPLRTPGMTKERSSNVPK